MKYRILTLICIFCLLISSCSGSDNAENNEESNIQQTENSAVLSDFSAKDLEGSDIDESILGNYKLTMVNAWATFCGPCINEMPELGELAKSNAENGVQIIGFVTDVLNSDGSVNNEQIELAKEIAEKTGADYTHIVPSQDLFGILMQITAVPTTFFVDSSGNLVGKVYSGAKSGEQWQEIIDMTLEETAQ